MLRQLESRKGGSVNSHVRDEWPGWDGDTIVTLDDGTVWQQVEYYYNYRYTYRPAVTLTSDRMHVDGMSRAVQVRQLR
jgi:hypothetical protein